MAIAMLVGDTRASGCFMVASIFVALVIIMLVWKSAWRATKFVGAPVWPVLGLLPSMLIHFRHIHDWITDLAIQNGGTFRLHGPWRTTVVTADPANIEYVLKSKYHNFIKGDDMKAAMGDFVGESSHLVQNKERFEGMSKSIAIALASAGFRDIAIASIPMDIHQNLLPLLGTACNDGTVIDLQLLFNRFAFEIVCRMGFGIDHTSSIDETHKILRFLQAFNDVTDSILYRLLMHSVCWKMLIFLNMGMARGFLEAKEYVDKFVQDLFSRWKLYEEASSLSRYEIMSAFIRLERECGRIHSDAAMRGFVTNLVFAGKDTLYPGLTWFFLLLARHPRVERKILAELRHVIKQRAMGNNVEPGEFGFEELTQMHYLHAALTESLRLYPPVPYEIVEAADKEVLPDGTQLQKGSRVVYLIYSSARMKYVWGDDCKEFKPERWLKDDIFVNESEFKFPVFNGGPRRCSGKKLAYWQMKWVAASILVRYRVCLASESIPVPRFGITLSALNGLPVIVYPREA